MIVPRITYLNLAICSIVLYSLIWTIIIASQSDTQKPKSSFSLQRSNSDPKFNRNNENHNYRSFSYRDKCKTNYNFDYIALTLLWPPGSCSTSPRECKQEKNTHFTVHGMWPTIKGTEEPSNCCFDNTFDFSALSNLLPTLNEYWFNFYNSNNGNRGFWSHEWLKHGTCSRDIPSLSGEVRYFGTTVQLASRMPLLEVLRNSSIIPDNQKVYRSIDVSNALKTISQGKNLQIDCDYEHNQPIPILTGISFCFDINLKPVDCPEMKRRCQRQLIFPYTSSRTFKPIHV